MPFTFSHAAAVLPFTYLPKRWVSLTGLFIGSIVPDFEYFLTMNTRSQFSHSYAGIFWFDLPLALLLTFVFHNVIRNSLFDNLPLFLKSRVWAFSNFDWNKHFRQYWYVISISIILGAATHVLWDDLIHHNGFLRNHFDLFAGRVEIAGTSIGAGRLFKIMSTLIGGLLVLVTIFKLPRDKAVKETIDVRYWLMIFLVVFVIVGIRFSDGLHFYHLRRFVITCISAGMIALTITPKFMMALSRSGRQL